MTPHAFSSLVFDSGPLAAADLNFRLQRLVLRAAVHAGLRWVLCPDAASQSLAGRALFDLRGWRCIVPLPGEDLLAEARCAALRLRRSRIDLAALPSSIPPLGRGAKTLQSDPSIGGIGYAAADAARLTALLRSPRTHAIFLAPEFDRSAWRDPALTSLFAARADVMCMARQDLALAPGVNHTICAAASPRELARLFAALGRPRRRDAVPAVHHDNLSEAA
jgi:hypothetical protein